MEHVLDSVTKESEVVNPPILTAFARTPRVLQNVHHILSAFCQLGDTNRVVRNKTRRTKEHSAFRHARDRTLLCNTHKLKAFPLCHMPS